MLFWVGTMPSKAGWALVAIGCRKSVTLKNSIHWKRINKIKVSRKGSETQREIAQLFQLSVLREIDLSFQRVSWMGTGTLNFKMENTWSRCRQCLSANLVVRQNWIRVLAILSKSEIMINQTNSKCSQIGKTNRMTWPFLSVFIWVYLRFVILINACCLVAGNIKPTLVKGIKLLLFQNAFGTLSVKWALRSTGPQNWMIAWSGLMIAVVPYPTAWLRHFTLIQIPSSCFTPEEWKCGTNRDATKTLHMDNKRGIWKVNISGVPL